VSKICRHNGNEYIEIKANEKGEMCIDSLEKVLKDLGEKYEYFNIIIVANFGSIYSTGFDDIKKIKDKLD
jgi:glutamate/tyrosine decarboxylase-like PLP-dependent enzyme